MNNKKNVIIATILFVVMILSTVTATYAYFTASNAEFEFDEINVSSATLGRAYAQSGSEINLLVDSQYMVQGMENQNIPIATKNNDQPFILTLETTDSGGKLECTYDIVYVPSIPFYNSTENLSNVNEFTIKGNANINGDEIPETSLGNVTSEITLLSGIDLSLEGVNKKKSQEWTFTVGFYNQSFNQDSNQGITFGGNVMVKNLTCKNDFVSSNQG